MAIRIRQNGESEDIDPDDMGINDGTVQNEKDLAVFQQTFLDEGANVKTLNKAAEDARQKEEENDTQLELDKDNLLSTQKGQNLERQRESGRLQTQFFTQEAAKPADPNYRAQKTEGIVDATFTPEEKV